MIPTGSDNPRRVGTFVMEDGEGAPFIGPPWIVFG
jgi:hypothetical protein